MYDKVFLNPGILFIALLGGILPATFWLWFWLKEDKLHPEPRGLLILSFLVGMLAALLAFPPEKWVKDFVAPGGVICKLMNADCATLLLFWAIIEEVIKIIGIYLVALRTKYFDEPIDAVIYLITIALGFAALENTLFLFNPLGNGDVGATITLGEFRFIGATLLHVATSGMVGVALALTFYQKRSKRVAGALLALCGAIMLHTLFNFSIIISSLSKEGFLYEIFIGLWIFIIGILLICEKIKRMAPRSHVLYAHTGIVSGISSKII